MKENSREGEDGNSPLPSFYSVARLSKPFGCRAGTPPAAWSRAIARQAERLLHTWKEGTLGWEVLRPPASAHGCQPWRQYSFMCSSTLTF